MNHLELVERTARKTGLDEKDVRCVLECAFETIIDEVADDGKVVVGHFGTFKSGLKRRGPKADKSSPRKKKLVLTPSSTLDEKLGHE